MSRRSTSSFVVLLAVCACASAAAVHAQQAPARPSAAVRIGGFEVNGLTRLKPAQVIALTQLREGQVFDIAAMDGAIARLAIVVK